LTDGRPPNENGVLRHGDGHRVLTTASSENFDIVKGLGADEVSDYRDEGVVEKIRAAADNVLNITIDTISEGRTPEQVTGANGDKGGKVAMIPSLRESLSNR
jgi:NADPH:quinone reductase-like Zn-dependent oxidoreductase